MLMVPDQAALEKQRKRKEEMKNGGVFSSYSSSGRRMFPAGDGVGRYEFWTDDGLVEQDKFEFGVELPMCVPFRRFLDLFVFSIMEVER